MEQKHAESYKKLEKAIKQRNRSIKNGERESAISSWDRIIAEEGETVTSHRAAFIEGLKNEISKIQGQVSKKEITVCSAKYEIPLEYGTLDIKDGGLIGLHEKPIKKYFINAGIYVIEPSVIKSIQTEGKFDMTDLLMNYINKKSTAVFPLHEQWLDIGNHKDYEKAQE